MWKIQHIKGFDFCLEVGYRDTYNDVDNNSKSCQSRVSLCLIRQQVITQDIVDQVHNAMFEGICSWYLPRLLVWNAVVYEQMSCIRNYDKDYSLLEMSAPCIGDECPMHWWWVAHALEMSGPCISDELPMHWWWVAHALVMSGPCIGDEWPMHWWWVAHSSLLVWILVHIVYHLPQCTIMSV